MKKNIFVYLLFLFPLTVLQAQKENKVFEKVELEAHPDRKEWAAHISKKNSITRLSCERYSGGNL